LCAGGEYSGDGVGGNWDGIFDVPVVGIITPEEGNTTFAGTSGACGKDIVSELEGHVFVQGEFDLSEDSKVKVELINCPKCTF